MTCDQTQNICNCNGGSVCPSGQYCALNASNVLACQNTCGSTGKACNLTLQSCKTFNNVTGCYNNCGSSGPCTEAGTGCNNNTCMAYC